MAGKTKVRQTIDLTITVEVDQERGDYVYPSDAVYRMVGLLREDSDSTRVVDFEVTHHGDREVIEPPVVNRAKLVELATWAAGEHAKEELGLPSEWNQGAWLRNGLRIPGDGWSCGTACCIAGRAVLTAGEGWRPDFAEDYLGMDTGRIVQVDDDGEELARSYVEEEAKRILGLNDGQAMRLFSGQNGLADVIAAVRSILDESADDETTGEE